MVGALVACVGLAGASLLWQATPGFDPWVWLVWGREATTLELDTTAGAAWKPLPVLVTSVLSLAGGAAPALWLVVARVGGLLAVVVTYRLAARLAGRPAGAVAAGALLVTPDAEARFVRLVVQGSIEPLVVALCLGAVERHLDGREGQALALVVLAGLARPEVWPFLALYGLWLWSRRPGLRGAVALGLGVVPLLWFGGDWLGSGDPLTGAARAQVSGSQAAHVERALERIVESVILPVWPAAVVGVLVGWRRAERVPLVLAGLAVGWMVVVGGLTVTLGYAARGRFLLPAAAVVCVLAGVGVVRALALLRSDGVRVGAAAALLALTAVVVVPRVRAAADEVALTLRRELLDRELVAAIERAGPLGACGPVAIEAEGIALSSWPALAWHLRLPVAAVGRQLPRSGGAVVALTDGAWARRLAGVVPVRGRSGVWTVFCVDRRLG